MKYTVQQIGHEMFLTTPLVFKKTSAWNPWVWFLYYDNDIGINCLWLCWHNSTHLAPIRSWQPRTRWHSYLPDLLATTLPRLHHLAPYSQHSHWPMMTLRDSHQQPGKPAILSLVRCLQVFRIQRYLVRINIRIALNKSSVIMKQIN